MSSIGFYQVIAKAYDLLDVTYFKDSAFIIILTICSSSIIRRSVLLRGSYSGTWEGI